MTSLMTVHFAFVLLIAEIAQIMTNGTPSRLLTHDSIASNAKNDASQTDKRRAFYTSFFRLQWRTKSAPETADSWNVTRKNATADSTPWPTLKQRGNSVVSGKNQLGVIGLANTKTPSAITITVLSANSHSKNQVIPQVDRLDFFARLTSASLRPVTDCDHRGLWPSSSALVSAVETVVEDGDLVSRSGQIVVVADNAIRLIQLVEQHLLPSTSIRLNIPNVDAQDRGIHAELVRPVEVPDPLRSAEIVVDRANLNSFRNSEELTHKELTHKGSDLAWNSSAIAAIFFGAGLLVAVVVVGSTHRLRTCRHRRLEHSTARVDDSISC